MPHSPEFFIKYLEAISFLVTIFSSPLIAMSVIAAFGQIKNQTKIAKYQISLQALLAFSSEYQKISTYRNELRERFENGDKSINERSVLKYFNMYWVHCLNQWNFFEKGLIPRDTFISWAVFAVELMSDRVIFQYYDSSGMSKDYRSGSFFEDRFIPGAYRNDRAFYDFYVGLYEFCQRGSIPDSARYEAVARYITNYARKKKIAFEG